MKQKFTAFWIAVFSAVICFSINCFAQDYTLPRFEELDGKRIAIETGTTYDDTIIVTNAIQNADFRYYQSLLDCLVAVSSGNADALALDTPYAAAIINSSDEYRLLNGYLYEDEYGFVLKKNSPLTKEFNRVIAEMKNDGTIDRLFEKWTSADQSMKVLTKQDWEGSRGTLTFCTLGDSEPVAYQINSDEVVGFDVDIAVNIAKRLDYKLIVKVTDFSSLVPAVDSGRADFEAKLILVDPKDKPNSENDGKLAAFIEELKNNQGMFL